jgi:hypothetical protein
MLGHGIQQIELEAQAWHKQFALIARLAFESYGIVIRQLLPDPLPHQPDLCRPDGINGFQDDYKKKQN